MKNSVIFGGSGFIGTFFARHLIEEHGYEKVYLFDHELISAKEFDLRKKMATAYPQIKMIEGDVRKPIKWIPTEKLILLQILQLFIVNLSREL